MSQKPVFLTPEGLRKLQDEIEYFKTVRRSEVASRIRSAKEEGDLTENAEYDDAKNEQAFVEGRILTLEQMLNNHVLIVEGPATDQVKVGSRVTLAEDGEDPETYQIVGSAEADPSSGRISNESPLGKALLAHKEGDTVQVNTPGGVRRVSIITLA
jgi:transcription elongation factor GreA